MFRAPITPPSL